MLRIHDHKNTSQNYKRAKELRQQSPMPERLLWNALCELPKPKPKFRRQYPIKPYIADFICLKAKLIVEIDGMSHDACQGYDKARDAYLKEQGFVVLRFTNEQVLESLEGVVMRIVEKANGLIANKNQA